MRIAQISFSLSGAFYRLASTCSKERAIHFIDMGFHGIFLQREQSHYR